MSCGEGDPNTADPRFQEGPDIEASASTNIMLICIYYEYTYIYTYMHIYLSSVILYCIFGNVGPSY